MSFDVRPGCDHGHDEESRNGRDMKIDILEAYVWISEVFRVKSGFYRSTRRLPEPPGGLNGPTWALVEKEGSKGSVGRAPLGPNRIGLGQRGPAPLFPSSPLPSPNPTRKRGGVLLPVGVGLLRHASPLGRPHPPCSFIYRGRGAPERHNN